MDLMGIRRAIIAGQDQFIPPGYQRYDYLQTISHNAKFDSGVPGDDTTLKIEFEWMLSKGTAASFGSYFGMMGMLNESGKTRWACLRNTTNADPNATYWLATAATASMTIYPFGSGVTTADKKMLFKFEYGKVEINGVAVTKEPSQTIGSGNIYFGTTSPTSSGISNNIGRFWYIKMWSHGKLIRNYVPCVRKSDSKAGFYDTVNCTFNPSIGSAEFVAGND